MKERKNIENLFQESFKNFEAVPPENAWENIEARLLEKKDKRRIIPFWWKLSGIAALLVLGFLLVNSIYNTEIPNVNSVMNEENSNKSTTNEPVVNSSSNAKNQENVVKNNNTPNSSASEIVVNNDNTNVSPEQNINKNSGPKIEKNYNKKNLIQQNSVAGTTINSSDKNKNYKTQSKSEKQVERSNAEVITNSVAQNNKKQTNENAKTNNKFNKNTIIGLEKFENTIVAKSKSTNSESIFPQKNEDKIQKSIVSEDSKTNFIKKLNSHLLIISTENNTITENEITKNDSTKIAIVESNALEELLNEKEKKTIITEQKLNRWQVSTNVAPIYFSSTSTGSPLDSEFKENSKSYNTNLSYGLGVNYAVNKKLKIRTGVNKLSVDYTTNDIVFFQNNSATKIEHVTSNTQGSVIQLESKNSNQALPEINGNGFVVKKFDSGLNQKFGYIEVPLEMSYSIINKKFGIDVIGGLSTLLLNENEITIVASGVNMSIGEADNLNDIHFSGNLGLGFKYGIFKNLEARVEPVFKYQINTFTSDDGNFKPYVFGVYSGMTYTF